TLELALLRAARPQLDPTRQALLQRVEDLERRLAGGAEARLGEQTGVEPTIMSAQSGARRHEPAHPPTEPSSASEPDPESPASNSAEDQEAEPARGPSAVAVEEGLDIERIGGLWPAVLDQMRDSGFELLSTVFSVARPVRVSLEQRVLEVGFPPSAAFNKRKAEAPEARDHFVDAVNTIVGERLRPVYVLLEGDPEAEGGAEAELSEEELIDRLKSEFDAEEFEEAENLDAEEAR
ncbi:MAG: hypothetical protein ACRDMH_12850, partial [Solirubrobacterales bacterium]